MVDIMTLYSTPVGYVHMLLRAHVHEGDVVIDATHGNGGDTRLLRSLVGPKGVVYAFDVQLPMRADVDMTDVLLVGHENMARHVAAIHHRQVRAVVFNLGYLPGGDKALTTHVDTTVEAVEQAITLIAPDGIIILVCYQHDEGRRELAALRTMLSALPSGVQTATETVFLNHDVAAPIVLTIAGVQRT